MRYIVAGVESWNKLAFNERSKAYAGTWLYVESPEELSHCLAQVGAPSYIFFIHWRWIVPEEITSSYECICFHMTPLPYGRGGSPLQNLISRGHKDTVLTAIRMDEGIDTGPIYFQKPMSLDGPAWEIYARCTSLAWDLIDAFVTAEDRPLPVPQVGEVTQFSRRTPAQSEISEKLSLTTLYDFIRMLDAPGYPPAFLSAAGFKFSFSLAELKDNKVEAKVVITEGDVQ